MRLSQVLNALTLGLVGQCINYDDCMEDWDSPSIPMPGCGDCPLADPRAYEARHGPGSLKVQREPFFDRLNRESEEEAEWYRQKYRQMGQDRSILPKQNPKPPRLVK